VELNKNIKKGIKIMQEQGLAENSYEVSDLLFNFQGIDRRKLG